MHHSGLMAVETGGAWWDLVGSGVCTSVARRFGRGPRRTLTGAPPHHGQLRRMGLGLHTIHPRHPHHGQTPPSSRRTGTKPTDLGRGPRRNTSRPSATPRPACVSGHIGQAHRAHKRHIPGTRAIPSWPWCGGGHRCARRGPRPTRRATQVQRQTPPDSPETSVFVSQPERDVASWSAAGTVAVAGPEWATVPVPVTASARSRQPRAALSAGMAASTCS